MQLRHFFIAGVLSLLTFVSCSKKDNGIKAGVPIEGTWEGKSSILSGPYNKYFGFKIKAGGVLELLDANRQKTGEGSWALTNDDTVITGSYTLLPPAGGTYSFIGNVKNVKAELDGSWGNGQKQYGGGYWFMNRVN